MNSELTSPLILSLTNATATLEQVGGKGASLTRMVQAGLPVPAGFHITTTAYHRFVAENKLTEPILSAASSAVVDQPATLEAASCQIQSLFAQGSFPADIAAAIRQAYAELGADNLPVAVRSSATAEDLPEMSFAGQQESYLNIRGETRLLDAVKRCWASLWTGRAIGYRARHGIAPAEVSLAVVVQELVPAEAAGILFTANPLTGQRDQMMINAAWGLGEAIVGGQVTPDTFVLDKQSEAILEEQIQDKQVMTVRTPEGTQTAPVPDVHRTQPSLTSVQVAELTRLGQEIETLYGQPMDIEWVLHNNRLAIVQARPITALPEPAPDMEEWNNSLAGYFLWTSTNAGEAVADVMTPVTWSLVQIFMSEMLPVSSVDGYPAIGNIGGRFYLNLSVLASGAAAIGLSKTFADGSVEIFGHMPAGWTIPPLPVSRVRLLREYLFTVIRFLRKIRAVQKDLPAQLAAAPQRAEDLRTRIQNTTELAQLRQLWISEVEPYFRHANLLLSAGIRKNNSTITKIRQPLRKLLADGDVNALLTGFHSPSDELASLGPVLGLAQLAHGEIDRESYARKWGHRSPHEFEVSIPRPAEDPTWIDQQLAGLRNSEIDAEMLLARQEQKRRDAWERFTQQHPRQVAALRQRLDAAAVAARTREAGRSEAIRAFWVLRTYVLRAGELTGQGDALFFLTIQEILALLTGDTAPLSHVARRREAYNRYRSLPAYPTWIRGRFDPMRWAADPHRRNDVYDERGDAPPVSNAIIGFPGAVGVVEGTARVIATAEEGDQLQVGEILVTNITNIGWTPLFPRAAAVVTDVGAPLSHAAIVARELGIPAVVGCGNATMRLHTGDRVRVDGERGTVELL